MPLPRLQELPPPPSGKTGWPWTAESPPLPATRPDGSPWPTISIVTPSYNQAPFLEETIRSVLLQGYPALEYIVMDGGSTDGSKALIEKYAPWLTAWTSEPDGGQTDAINKGWQRSSGELVAWLNSDDFYLPAALAQVAHFWAAHPHTDIAYGACTLIDEHGHPIAHATPPPFDFGRALRANFIAQPATFMRRTVINTLGGVNQKRHYAFDYELWLQAALQGFQLAPIPGPPLATFRLWEASKTESSAEKFVAETLDILDEIFTSPKLPPALAPLRRTAMAGAWREASFGCYRAGQMAACRHCIRQMAKLDPTRLANTEILALFARTLLGPTLNATARHWKRTLYRRFART